MTPTGSLLLQLQNLARSHFLDADTHDEAFTIRRLFQDVFQKTGVDFLAEQPVTTKDPFYVINDIADYRSAVHYYDEMTKIAQMDDADSIIDQQMKRLSDAIRTFEDNHQH